jgi:hypothetical protein
MAALLPPSPPRTTSLGCCGCNPLFVQEARSKALELERLSHTGRKLLSASLAASVSRSASAGAPAAGGGDGDDAGEEGGRAAKRVRVLEGEAGPAGAGGPSPAGGDPGVDAFVAALAGLPLDKMGPEEAFKAVGALLATHPVAAAH